MKSPPLYYLLCVALSLFGFMIVPAFAGSEMMCSQSDQKIAEEKSSTARSWNALYHLYKTYGHCDDGAIAEGFSESVSLLFIKQWTQIRDLDDLSKKDEAFETFALKHLDETLPNERLADIEHLAKENCPIKHARLCAKIVVRLQKIRVK